MALSCSRLIASFVFGRFRFFYRAGYKVTVVDSSDPDWWQGKCLGKIGYFPSKYVAKLAPNETPLQVTHNVTIQVNEGDGTYKLLRDQVRPQKKNRDKNF